MGFETLDLTVQTSRKIKQSLNYKNLHITKISDVLKLHMQDIHRVSVLSYTDTGNIEFNATMSDRHRCIVDATSQLH